MAKYRVFASYVVSLSTLVEADSSQDAYEKAKDLDGSEFYQCGYGDWTIDSDPQIDENDEVYS